jgi:Family of unknown function (DUF5719)
VNRGLRLGSVLVAGAAVVAGGALVRVPSLDVASLDPTAARTEARTDPAALPARSAAVQRAELVCPGPETIGVRGVEPVGTAPAPATVDVATPSAGSGASPAADVRVRSLPGAALTTRSSADAAPTRSSADAAARLGSASSGAAAGIGVTATGAAAPGLVAGQTTTVPSGDLRGLSSTACAEPADDAWLVAGGTEPGRRGRVVLVNPAANAVDVDVEVLGESGPVPRSAGSSVGVPARSRVVLLLDALAPGVRSPVVHVRTTGGAVAATLSDAWLSGTTPLGVDDAAPAAAPGRRVLVPAVLGGGPSSVRIASTGPTEAVVQVRVLGGAGDVELAGGGVLRVPAQGSRTLDLGRLTPGGYVVEVVSDAPVVAGALLRRTGAASDLAWFSSSAPVESPVGTAGLRGAPGWGSWVVVGAPRDRVRGDLVTMRLDGSTTTRAIDVAAGRVTTVGTGDAVAAWVRPRAGTGELVAARVTAHRDARGPMVTGGALRPAPDQQRLPAVVPAG